MNRVALAAAAFDRLAANYDLHFERNPVMAWMRGESLALLEATFPPGSRLLELGCGTGTEAAQLLQSGLQVVATDVSGRMVQQARRRLQPLGGRVHHLGAAEAAELEGPFDGAYSSFGALNCEPDLEAVAQGLAGLVRPGGWVVLGVMARRPVFEAAWHLARGRWADARRRWSPGWHEVHVSFGAPAVPVRYFTLTELLAAFRPVFRLRQALALPLLLPPPHLQAFFARHRTWFRRLEPLERRLRGWPLLRELGDHLVVVLQREGPPGGRSGPGRAVGA